MIQKIARTLVPFCFLILSSHTVFAASLAASCFMADDSVGKIEGTEINKRMPIASVSKIMTSYWATIEKGLDYRFATKINVTAVGNGIFDVHLEGSRDPYFGKESLHFLLSELNKIGVKNVRTLSFDENFKFFWEITSYNVSAGSWKKDSPGPKTVLAQLKQRNLSSGYNQTVAYARRNGLKIPNSIVWSQQKITYVPSRDYEKASHTQTYRVRSSPLETLLKEMNRNSNNHAAIQIFEHVGGAAKFATFIKDRLGLTEKEIKFNEGSGNNSGTGNKSEYNEATCSAVLKVIKDYRTVLLDQKKDLKNVIAVVGGDQATVTMYSNNQTRKAVVAKSGTVSPNVTLGGYVATKKGNYYFFYSMSANGTKPDWARAREAIAANLKKWVASKNGGVPMEYKAVTFNSFDSESSFTQDADATEETLVGLK